MPYAAIILGPKYDIRLSQLLASDAMDVTCSRCQRFWRVAPHRLHDRYPAHQRLLDLEHAMRCTKCGSRGEAMAWTIVRASPPGR